MRYCRDCGFGKPCEHICTWLYCELFQVVTTRVVVQYQATRFFPATRSNTGGGFFFKTTQRHVRHITAYVYTLVRCRTNLLLFSNFAVNPSEDYTDQEVNACIK